MEVQIVGYSEDNKKTADKIADHFAIILRALMANWDETWPLLKDCSAFCNKLQTGAEKSDESSVAPVTKETEKIPDVTAVPERPSLPLARPLVGPQTAPVLRAIVTGKPSQAPKAPVLPKKPPQR